MLTLISIRSHFQNEFQNYILDKLDKYAKYYKSLTLIMKVKNFVSLVLDIYLDKYVVIFRCYKAT